jgi:hypothetical protein
MLTKRARSWPDSGDARKRTIGKDPNRVVVTCGIHLDHRHPPLTSEGGSLMTTTICPISDISTSAPPTNHQSRAGTNISSVTSPKRLARIAGVLYLFVGT